MGDFRGVVYCLLSLKIDDHIVSVCVNRACSELKSRKCGDRVRKEQPGKMASRLRFVACALLLAISTQALARPDKLEEDSDLESQTTESKDIEEQQESGQFFPSPSVSPSINSPNAFCGCEEPATKISGADTIVPPPGYYSCAYTFLLINAYCPFTNRDVACTCPQGFLFGSKLTDESIVCYSTSFSAYGEGLWVFPCDDDDDDDFFPSPSASFPSIPSFLQEAADSEAGISDLLNQSEPVEELKTDDLHLNDDLDLDTSGSTKSRDSRVQALTNKRHQSLHKLMDALKE